MSLYCFPFPYFMSLWKVSGNHTHPRAQAHSSEISGGLSKFFLMCIVFAHILQGRPLLLMHMCANLATFYKLIFNSFFDLIILLGQFISLYPTSHCYYSLHTCSLSLWIFSLSRFVFIYYCNLSNLSHCICYCTVTKQIPSCCYIFSFVAFFIFHIFWRNFWLINTSCIILRQ